MQLKLFKDKTIKNIIFDLGNVILDIDISLTINQFMTLGIEGLKVEDIHPNQKDFFLDLELGTISNEQFIEKIRETYPKSGHVTAQQIWDAWNILLFDFEPKRIQLLKELAKRYNIYLLSNTNLPHRVFYLEQFRRNFGYEFESLFKKCYYSDAMHMRKPNADIYQSVIDDAAIIASESLFIDDNICNFTGAEEVGLNWYHLTGGETILDLFE